MNIEIYEPAEPVRKKIIRLALMCDGIDKTVSIDVVDKRGMWIQTIASICSGGMRLHALAESFVKKYGVPVDSKGRIHIHAK